MNVFTDAMIIDEYIDPEGNHQIIECNIVDDQIVLSHRGVSKPVAPRSIPMLFSRYGLEIDPTIEVDPQSIRISNFGKLGKFRFKSPVDADCRDYLVWDDNKDPVQTALARQITSSLCYLADLKIDHPQFCA